MEDADLATARQLVLSGFRWLDGHADLSRVFRNADVLGVVGVALAAPFSGAGVTVVASPEARGFVLGALVARELGSGLVLVRKQGSHHPGASMQARTGPDWRGRELALGLQPDVLGPSDPVLVVDDASEPTRHRLNLHGLLRSAELPADEQPAPG